MRAIEDLTDTTFIIPFMIDHPDRLENLNCILKNLSYSFRTNFVLVECGKESFKDKIVLPSTSRYIFQKTDDGLFHRTKHINTGIKIAWTKYISIYDADCIFSQGQILEAVEALRKGATLSYPYYGNFMDIERSYITDRIYRCKESFTTESVGGACFLNRNEYIKMGGEREEYQSWCPDDITRYEIVKKLGYEIVRIPGDCYHITHWRGENSGPNKYTEKNNEIFQKIKAMSINELIDYITNNNWLK